MASRPAMLLVTQGITVSSLSRSHLLGQGVRCHAPDTLLGSRHGPPPSACLTRALATAEPPCASPAHPRILMPPGPAHLATAPKASCNPSEPPPDQWPVVLHSGLQLGLSCKRLERLGMTKGAWRLIRSSNESLIHKSKHFPSINLQPVKGNV